MTKQQYPVTFPGVWTPNPHTHLHFRQGDDFSGESRACAPPHRFIEKNIMRIPRTGAWFRLHSVDRIEAGRTHIAKAEEMGDKEKRKKDKNSSGSDRVTLKKEIGLLSACAIIIGECTAAIVTSSQMDENRIRHSTGSLRWFSLHGKVNGETCLSDRLLD